MTTMKSYGEIDMEFVDIDGSSKFLTVKNNLLNAGRLAVLKNLTSSGSPSVYVSKMVWGDGGVSGGRSRAVDVHRTGLFGTVRARKSLISQYSEDGTKGYFLATLKRDDAVGYTINEMGLELSDGTMYAMSTFPGYYKESTMQINYTWRVYYL